MVTRHRFKIDKLVRDKTPHIWIEHNITEVSRVMDEGEYIARLKDKILEEAKEVIEAQNTLELTEELADVMEVVLALASAHGISGAQIEEARLAKREAKGGFEKRVYGEYIEVDTDTPGYEYCKANPEKYPEIEKVRYMMMKIEQTFTPHAADVDFLTTKINEEFESGQESVYPFGFFIRDNAHEIIAGCNGFVILGVVYIDQLWVHRQYRGQGVGRTLMEKVHEFGRSRQYSMSTVNTMNFQDALEFYKKLGYKIDFERSGYAHDSRYVFLSKRL